MHEVNELRLCEVSGQEELRRVTDGAGRTGPITLGHSLDAQYRCETGYVVLISEDWPIEEHLYIVMLTENLKLLDEITVGAWYCPGALRSLAKVGEHLEFEIFGYRWSLTLHKNPRRWPHYGCPRGARRPASRVFALRQLELVRLGRLE